MENQVSWLGTLVTYGPLGVFAAVIGFVWLWKQIKGDPVQKLVMTCAEHIASSNEIQRVQNTLMERVTTCLEESVRGREVVTGVLKEMQAEHKDLEGKFDAFTRELKNGVRA